MNKYLTFFSKLSPSDWQLFTKYVYLNYPKNKLIIKLLNYLDKKHPLFNVSDMKINMLLYNTKDSNKTKFLWNRLYKISLEFVEFNAVKNSMNKRLENAKYFKKINAQVQFNKSIDTLKKTYKSYDYETSLYINLDNREQITKLGNRSKEPKIQNIHDSLDQNYIYEKLKTTCASLSYSQLQNFTYDYGILNFLSGYLDNWVKSKDDLIKTWYYTYQLLINEDDIYFNKILQLLKSKQHYPKDDLADLYKIAINFCIRNINKGNEQYFTKIYEIYKAQINSQSLYDEEGFISPFTVKNILTVSLRLNELKWSENFIKSHKEKLPQVNREENYDYNLARIYFAKKDYKMCLRYVLRSEPLDFLNNISSRVLQIKALYSIDDVNAMDNALHNFRLFLLRHKNKGYHYIFHVHFIRMMKKIISLPSYSNKITEPLIAEINKSNNIAEKKWLVGILQSK